MKPLSVKDKTAYFAKVRAKNYVASLRLEGIAMPGTKAVKTVSAGDTSAKVGKRHQAK